MPKLRNVGLGEEAVHTPAALQIKTLSCLAVRPHMSYLGGKAGHLPPDPDHPALLQGLGRLSRVQSAAAI